MSIKSCRYRTRLYKAELAGARDMEAGIEQEAKTGCNDASLTATLLAAQAKARACPNRTTSRKRRKADYIEFDSHLVRPKIRVRPAPSLMQQTMKRDSHGMGLPNKTLPMSTSHWHSLEQASERLMLLNMAAEWRTPICCDATHS